jgi:hypothetical protein
MSSIGGMLGLSGGQSGTGYSTSNPVSSAQVAQAGQDTQSAISQQQALLNAIQAQNGLGNQSQVYNQLQGVVNGTGANPATALLNQQTGANVANQAALMAGQRGAASNVGLIARQAAQQGANTQQQAVGQAATTQANQSLNALSAAGSLANTQASNQLNASSNLANTSLGNQNSVYGAQGNYNSAQAGLAQTTMGQQGQVLGGLLQGVGGTSQAVKAEGGLVTKPVAMADGGDVTGDPSAANLAGNGSGPQSALGRFAKGFNQGQPASALQQGVASATSNLMNAFKPSPMVSTAAGTNAGGPMDAGSTTAGDTMRAARGGQVPALVSPGERYLPPQEVKKVAEGKKAAIKAGEKIPGEAPVKGAKNSYANDIVPKTLEEGGIVLPRSVTQAKDAPKKAAEFVAAIMKKNALKGKK